MDIKNNTTELFHITKKENLESIKKHGLNRKHLSHGRECQFLYLTKFPEKWFDVGDVILRVHVPNKISLTCFEENIDGTEVLCWGDINPENIEVFENES